MVFSKDPQILKMIPVTETDNESDVSVLNESQDPLDIMSAICSHNPSVVLIDDDFLKPHSAHVLRSVRKINSRVKIIFITSDESVELGREISPLGIHYYGHKPLGGSELRDSIESLINISTT